MSISEIIKNIVNFFKKDKPLLIENKENAEKSKNNVNDVKKDSFKENIEKYNEETQKEREKKVFMKNIKENPKLLEKFSNDRLSVILDYFLEENKEKEIKIEKLVKKSS